jgi:hypothetical protein
LGAQREIRGAPLRPLGIGGTLKTGGRGSRAPDGTRKLYAFSLPPLFLALSFYAYR